jgi:hypothetical protein
MIEIGIISIIVLAVGYWVTLWLMGRRDDVLHGDFVHAEPGTETAALSDPGRPPFPAKPTFPAKPMFPLKPSVAKAAVVKPAAANAASAQTLPAGPLPPSAPVPVSERLDTLQSLLATIKQDLKDASQL